MLKTFRVSTPAHSVVEGLCSPQVHLDSDLFNELDPLELLLLLQTQNLLQDHRVLWEAGTGTAEVSTSLWFTATLVPQRTSRVTLVLAALPLSK